MRHILYLDEFIKESINEKNIIISDPMNSTILDKSGKLLVVYKSADNRKFEASITDDSNIFTTSKKAALGFGKDINEYVLYLENPLYMTNYGTDDTIPKEWMNWFDVKEKYFAQQDPYKIMLEEGYDGFIELNDKSLYHKTVFDEILYPNNIIIFDTNKSKKISSRRWYEV